MSTCVPPPTLLTLLCPSHVHPALRAYQTQCPSADVVREVVLTHLKEKEVLDNSLPSSIVIGPFYINVDNVKQSLSKKRKALATSMLDILAKNLHKEVDSVGAHPPCLSDQRATYKHPCIYGIFLLAKCPQAGSGHLQRPRSRERTGSPPALMPACLQGAVPRRRLLSLFLNSPLGSPDLAHPEMDHPTGLRVCKRRPQKS